MNDQEYLKGFSGFVSASKPSAEKERLAEIRERQRRERKEKLYSYTHDKSLTKT